MPKPTFQQKDEKSLLLKINKGRYTADDSQYRLLQGYCKHFLFNSSDQTLRVQTPFKILFLFIYFE